MGTHYLTRDVLATQMGTPGDPVSLMHRMSIPSREVGWVTFTVNGTPLTITCSRCGILGLAPHLSTGFERGVQQKVPVLCMPRTPSCAAAAACCGGAALRSPGVSAVLHPPSCSLALPSSDPNSSSCKGTAQLSWMSSSHNHASALTCSSDVSGMSSSDMSSSDVYDTSSSDTFDTSA